jgi:hypothetical protein
MPANRATSPSRPPVQVPTMHEVRVALARHWGLRNGLKCNKGGWVRSTVNNRVIGQGWCTVYRRHYQTIWAQFQ